MRLRRRKRLGVPYRDAPTPIDDGTDATYAVWTAQDVSQEATVPLPATTPLMAAPLLTLAGLWRTRPWAR